MKLLLVSATAIATCHALALGAHAAPRAQVNMLFGGGGGEGGGGGLNMMETSARHPESSPHLISAILQPAQRELLPALSYSHITRVACV